MQIFKPENITPQTLRSARRAARRLKNVLNRRSYTGLYRSVCKRWKIAHRALPIEEKMTMCFPDFYDVCKAEIIAIDVISNYMIDMVIECNIVDIELKRYTLRFTKESRPYKLSRWARFRFDPRSLKAISTKKI